jgi:hypothetical protein
MSVAALPAEPATPESEDSVSLLADFNAVVAELGEAGDDADDDEPAAPVRGKDGKFLPKDKADAKPKEEPAKVEPEKDEPQGKVPPAERAQFREEKRRERAKLAQERQALEQQRAELNALASQVHASPKLRELAEAGRGDELAQALGYKDWNGINDHFARSFASPEYRRIRQLEQEREAEKAELAQQQQSWQQRQQAEQRAQWEAQATGEIADHLKAGADESLAALAEDPAFAEAVLRTMVSAKDRHEDLDIDEAADIVRELARKRYEHMQKAFGGRPTSQGEASQGAIPNRAGSKTQPARPVNKHVPRNSATEASPPVNEELTDEEWLVLANQEMRAAGVKERQLSKQR